MNDAPVIQTVDLTKRFGGLTAVDGVSFDVQRGEVFGFLGPNGAGKTTTIAMLLSLVRPTCGSAEVLGHDVQRNPGAALRRVGAIVETPAFYPYLSGIDNLRIMGRIADADRTQIPALLEQVGLEGRGNDKVGTYSLGMRQRLGLASALLGDPQLLILDEPTNGLDPAGMHEMRGFVRRLAEEEERTVFVSSHLLHEVEQICDRVLILDRGRLIAQGRVDELLSHTHAVEMRIAEAGRAARVLGELDWVRSADVDEETGGCLHVHAPPERAPEMLAALASHGLFPFEVRPVTSTLESVFLELTGEPSGGEAEEHDAR
jgi:ABC-2 type transport system ATP-binding protein